MVSALLIEWLMQATTTQNDLILAAYFGAMVYFLFAYRETNKLRYLALASVNIGLAIGTKASAFLPLVSVGLLAIYILFHSSLNLKYRFRHVAFWVLATLLALCIFALPAGYVENYRNFGHPIGPQTIRETHSFDGESFDYIFRNGTKNLIRYGFEFLSLDGLPRINVVTTGQVLIRILPVQLVHIFGIDLTTIEATREPFNLYKMQIAHEDVSYWGVLGFTLIWPVVLLSVVGIIKPTDLRILSIGAVLFILSQAYAGPYDPWRGRYFIIAAIFAVPVVSVCLKTQKKFLRAYLHLIVLAGCVSAIAGVGLRRNSSFISMDDIDGHMGAIFAMNRMEQLTNNRPIYAEPLKRFDAFVPMDSVVAVYLPEDYYEYPLFGERLTRTILPINSFEKGLQPIPLTAEYLLYAEGFPCARKEDVYLGADLYLRNLTDYNRKCPGSAQATTPHPISFIVKNHHRVGLAIVRI